MTRIDFHSNVPDPLLHTCKLIRKAVNAGSRVVCHCSDPARLDELDRALWAFSPSDFIAHVRVADPLAAQTPVLLSNGDGDPPVSHLSVLINLDETTPAGFSRFERLIEVVGREETQKSAARDRFRFYRDRGYALAHHDFSAH